MAALKKPVEKLDRTVGGWRMRNFELHRLKRE
jgi:hypothetical protein